ncbi:hypothetical protein [Georgenia sp. Z1491]|uniref:hypothetical protein n=1 Tax=Georgenia sp. Z1491 TaxID=3416707 RepID=UPI003CF18889
MHPTVTARLDVYRSMDTVPDAVVDAVADEVDRIDPGGALDDEAVGSFVSHLVSALARAVDGDTSVEQPVEAVYDEVRRTVPDADSRASELAARVSERLSVDVPEPERRFVAIHLAVIDQHQTQHQSQSKETS